MRGLLKRSDFKRLHEGIGRLVNDAGKHVVSATMLARLDGARVGHPHQGAGSADNTA